MAFDEEIKIGVDIDTGKATKSLEELAKDIQAITEKGGNKSSQRLGLEKQLDEALKKAQMLSKQLKDPLHFAVEDKSLTKALYNVERLEGELKKYQQFIKNKDLVMANALTDSEYNSAKSEKSNYAFEINHNIIPALDAAKRKLDEFKDASGDFKVNIDTDALHKTEDAYDSLISKISMLIKKEDELTAKENKVVGGDGGSGVQSMNRNLLSTYQIMRIVDNAFKSTANTFKRAFQMMANAVSTVWGALKNLASLVTGTLIHAFQKLASIVRSVASTLKNVFVKALRTSLNLITRIGKTGVSAFRKIADGIKSAVSAMRLQRKETEKTEHSFKNLLNAVLKYGFGIRSLYFLVRKLREFVKDGFSYLIDADDGFKSMIDQLKGGLDTIKLALTGAFAPLVEMVMPALMSFMHMLVDGIGYVSQFFAALAGKDTYRRAKWQVKSLEDTLKDLQETQEEEAKATKKQLAGFDELNNLTTSAAEKKKDKDEIKIPYDMLWEDVPVDNKIKGLLDKLKKAINDLLAPLKKAWAKWKDTILADLKDLWKWIKQLAKDFWRDFIKVWNGPDMAKVFDNLFGMFDDIIKTLRNLVRQFDIAWNTNNVGLHILEDIAHILRIITDHARNITKAFVEWSDTLDFYPLLAAIERWLKSCFRLVDAICQMIEDFVKIVFLPFLKYLIEVGVPKIFDAFTEFNDKVNWERLTELVRRFWTALEPLLEMSFEALIKGLRLLLDVIADFLNGNFIERFVEDFENLVASLKAAKGPMDVIDAIFEFFNRRLSAWIDLMNGLVGKLNGFFNSFRDMSSGMSNLQRLAQDISNLINTLLKETNWKGLGELVSNVLKTILELATEILNRIDKNALHDAIYNFLTGLDFVGIFEDVKAFILASADIIKTIAGAFIDVFRNAIGEITPESLATSISDLAITVLNFLTRVFESVDTEQLRENITTFLLNIKWKEIFESLGNFLSSAWEIIKAVGGGILDALKEAFKEVTPESLAEKVNNFAETIHKFISDQLDRVDWVAIGQAIGKFIAGVDWQEIWNNCKSDFNKLVSGLLTILQEILTENPEIKTGLERIMGKLATIFATIFVTKIALKIGEAWVINKLKTKMLTGALVPAVKSALAGLSAEATGGSLLGAATAAGTSIGYTLMLAVADAIVFFNVGKFIGKKLTGDDELYDNFKWFGDDGFFKAVGDGLSMIFNKSDMDHMSDVLQKIKDGTITTTAEIQKMAEKYGFTAGQVKTLEFELANQNGTLDEWKAKWTNAGDSVNTTTVEMDKAYGAVGSLDGELKTLSKTTEETTENTKDLGDKMGTNIVQGFKDSFVKMKESIAEWFTNTKTELSAKWEELKTATKEKASQLWDSVKEFWENLDLRSWFDTHIAEPIKSGASALIDGIKELWSTVAQWFNENVVEPLVTYFSEIWPRIKEFFSNLWEDVKLIWQSAAQWFNDTVVQPTITFFKEIWDKVKEFFKNLWDDVVTIWKGASTWFKENVIEPIKTFFKELWTKVKEFFQNLWDDVVDIWHTASQWFKDNVIDPTVEFFRGLWEDVKEIFNNLWEDIQSVWNTVATWFKENVIDPIVEFFRGLWEDIRTIFDNLWTDIKNIWNQVAGWFENEIVGKLREAWNGLCEFMGTTMKNVANGILDVFESAINWVIDKINAVSGTIAGIRSAFGGDGSYTVIEQISLPRLATGTVIPPSMNQFAAILGDNKHETEVVSPLSTIKDALIEALGTVGYGGNNGDIVVQIDGYEVFRAVREQNIMFTKSTGASAF